MRLMLKFFSLPLIIVLFAILVPQSVKADPCSDCGVQFHTCNRACSLTKPRSGFGCKLACQIDAFICEYESCPHQFALRNADVYTTNFFRANGTLLGTLSGVSPDRLLAETSDFPITAAYASNCPTLDDPKCQNNDHYKYVISEPGCYILWYAGGYYTTAELCYIKDAEGNMKAPPFPENKIPNSLEKKLLPATPASFSESKEAKEAIQKGK